ncbi:hypothetical protein OF829_12550 [Sphingomonas sp. LB-2]|uniref:hypothetical protein n=1 Tax=Sphingomonas caeni TaxID=2984949 RepID=UPI0022304758|nr:hypothetical protein [Sphingomonas caeni]MCW3848072.1 hypothetical protein [Sphingomonas caeni]
MADRKSNLSPAEIKARTLAWWSRKPFSPPAPPLSVHEPPPLLHSDSLGQKGEEPHPHRHWIVAEEKTTRTTLLTLAICSAIFFFALLWQQRIDGPDDYPELLRRCVGGATILEDCKAAITEFHEKRHTFRGIDMPLAGVDVLKSLSVALLVSVVVSNLFERGNRKRLNDTLSAKAEQISINVFDGLFGNSHPPAALTAIKKMLERPILRKRLDISYTLTIWETSEGRLAGRKFVCVDVVFAGLTQNIANPKMSQDASFDVPVSLSLPNPLVDELRPLVVLKSVKINDEPIADEALDRANAQIQAGFAEDSADGNVDICIYNLKPGEELRVEACYTMMKEFEDTEVFRSFQITEALTLSVIDRTGENLLIRARAIHPGTLRSIGSNASFLKWELYDIVLPQQGLMVWWKKPLPSASQPVSARQPRRKAGTGGAA